MIKLKDLLLENDDIFIPRRIENRLERMISLYIRNGSKGNLVLRLMNLTELPEILKNVSVDGSFDCSNNKLTSLINAPKSVVISFYCSTNHLTSLEGAPKFVGGDFYCTDNPVQFTRKGVKSVCNVKGRIFV
jgi:hypothetical protein